jgi:phosphate transport system substrate-binding protein
METNASLRKSLTACLLFLTVACVGGATSAVRAADVKVDDALPVYHPTEGVGGDLRVVGSDTMLNLMTHFAANFERHHPSVRVQVEGKGSSTAPPALVENQAQFGAMSRGMGPEEIGLFEERFGYAPTNLRIAVDCVAVFVHRDNPIESLSLTDVQRAFAVRGEEATWGDLGVTDWKWRTRRVSLYGRNSASGTYKYFKKIALGGEDFRSSVKEQPGSAGVVQAIATDQFGIGFSGIGYKTPGVRVVPLSFDTGETAYMPTVDAAYSGDYPMARFLYLYVNHDPRDAIDPLRERFARIIFSKQGQEQVIKDGSYPVSAEIARTELRKLGIEPGF